MPEELDDSDLFERERYVRGAFSPSAPIKSRDLFAGRGVQLAQLLEAVEEPGQHIVIYGERGAGKTSVASVSLALSNGVGLKVNAQSNDTFSSLWRKAFNEVKMHVSIPGFGLAGKDTTRIASAADYFIGLDEITPDHVRVGLQMVTTGVPLTVFFDEFDRLEASTHRLMADTLKTLSDDVVPATVGIVGVADDVDDLIHEHASVERALQQVHMPRMSFDELDEIITKGLDSVDMRIETTTRRKIALLSQGLPHYTHLLAQQSASAAVYSGTDLITEDDLQQGIRAALDKAQESINSLYYRATFSARRESLYKQVVLACAMATIDDRGFFTAAAVRDPMTAIMGRPYDIPQFATHLNQLSTDRGPLLRKEGTQKRYRYRFENPLMQPYVLMRGLHEDLIGAEDFERLFAG